MALSPNSETSNVTVDMVEVDEDGDVVLETNQPENKRRFRVSSKVLSLASPVLRKMFHSQFKEAMEIRKAPSPVCIELSDDDGEALFLVCGALHYRTNTMPEVLPIDTLVKVSILSDKYDMSAGLSGWSSTWVKKSMRSACNQGDFEDLLCAAYSLDAAEIFFEVSWKAICDQQGSFRTTVPKLDSPVNDTILGTNKANTFNSDDSS
jgi:hypothetical protein